MSDNHEERIASLETRVAELERLLKTASKGKARTSSVLKDCEDAAAVEIPLMLRTPAFRTAWQDFCKHRCDLATRGNINKKKFPWTPRAANGILKKCSGWGQAMAIEALNISIDKGWADIFEPPMTAGGTPGRARFEA